MTRKELEQLEHRKWEENVPLLDELYLIVDRKKHDSGYRLLKVYGIAFSDDYSQKVYCKELTNSSDVIDFRYEIKDLEKLNKNWGFPPFSIDCLECNVIRYFARQGEYKFRVGKELSSFEITLVEV